MTPKQEERIRNKIKLENFWLQKNSLPSLQPSWIFTNALNMNVIYLPEGF